MSAVYRVTVKLPNAVGTVIVRADDRAQAKARAVNQLVSMGHDTVTDDDVMLCRKDKPDTGVIGNRPAPTNGGKPA